MLAGIASEVSQQVLRTDVAGMPLEWIDYTHKLLSPKFTELVISPKEELSSPDYGYGFGVEERGGERVVGHGGGFSGISAQLDMHLGSGYTVVVLSNYDGGTQIVLSKIREILGRANN